MKTLHGYILTASILVSVIFFGGSYWLFTQVYKDSVRTTAQGQSANVARLTWQAMTQVMFQGWSREQLQAFAHTAQQSVSGSSVSINFYRGEAVTRRFGGIEQIPADDLIIAVMRHGKEAAETQGMVSRYVFPLVAESRCLGCHDNARVGEVLGSIDVRHDLSASVSQAERNFLTRLLLIAPLPFVAALLVVLGINRRIDRAVANLRDGVENINRVGDLKQLQPGQVSTGFNEFDQVFQPISELATRLRGLAVDRDLLEFEIRLMEKFIITSEVVKDWHEYIKDLLMEINQVIEAYTLFCVFKVEDELFSLEIFWRHQPEPELKRSMEAKVRATFQSNLHFREVVEVQINHTVCDTSRTMPPPSAEQLALQTKSLLVETPKIGGIVGIGVQAEVMLDDTRTLVMDSILSTLLNVVGSVRAIHKYTQDLEYYATRDPLTNLYNQRVFWELLEYEVNRASRHGQHFAVMVMDLDNFKTVNDTYGHHVGDQYLQAFAHCVRQALRSEDILARYGGDEFAALLPETDSEQAYAAAVRVLQAVSELSVALPDGGRAKASTSIGLAIYPDHAGNRKDLFLLADNMMYKAKSEGKNRIVLPTADDMAEAFRKIGEKSQIVLRAVEEDRVVPYFQPIARASDGQVMAVELLSRIQVEGALFEAGEFIELAEKMGVIHKLDYQVLDKALAEVQRRAYSGLLFVNLSPRALVLSEFLPEVKAMVARHGVAPQRIVFEITERETIKNISLLSQFVAALKLEGFRLAVDDFGSGFSSYHYLKHFPIDFIKIEGEFVQNMLRDGKDHAFVRSMASLARDLGIQSIAEFVESAEVLAQIQAAGVDYAQGWHIGRPTPNLDF